MQNQSCAVYRHYDENGRLLYVGMSVCPLTRTYQHMNGSAWSRDVATIKIVWLSSRQDAVKYEAAAIASEHPAHNTKGVRLPPSGLKPGGGPKDEFIKIRVTPDEKKEVQAAAKSLGVTVSNMLRSYLLEEMAKANRKDDAA